MLPTGKVKPHGAGGGTALVLHGTGREEKGPPRGGGDYLLER